MINIGLSDEIYHFPQGWDEVNLDKFIRVYNLKLEYPELEGDDLYAKIISILSGIDENILLDEIPFSEFCKLKEICKFVDDENLKDIKFEITINKKKYRMDQDITDKKTREVLDLDTLLKDKDSSIDKLHIIMAILYRPWTKKNGIEKYNTKTLYERAELFKYNMTCDYSIAATLFSLALGMSCIDYMADSLETDSAKTQK